LGYFIFDGTRPPLQIQTRAQIQVRLPL
jgi:hypothetical protein